MHACQSDFDERTEPRDEVYHRTRATLLDGRTVAVTVVNLSPHGLMARVEADVAVGEWVKVALPVIGTVGAAIRWSLGGRIGCRFERAVEPRPYLSLLAATGGC